MSYKKSHYKFWDKVLPPSSTTPSTMENAYIHNGPTCFPIVRHICFAFLYNIYTMQIHYYLDNKYVTIKTYYNMRKHNHNNLLELVITTVYIGGFLAMFTFTILAATNNI